jgi:hypothetical protein
MLINDGSCFSQDEAAARGLEAPGAALPIGSISLGLWLFGQGLPTHA